MPARDRPSGGRWRRLAAAGSPQARRVSSSSPVRSSTG